MHEVKKKEGRKNTKSEQLGNLFPGTELEMSEDRVRLGMNMRGGFKADLV